MPEAKDGVDEHMYLDVSLPVAVRHATCIDGGAENVPEAKDGVYERMYLDVSLPVGVRHATGIDGVAANVPEAKDRVDEFVPGCQSPCCRTPRDRYRRRSGECAGGEGQSI